MKLIEKYAEFVAKKPLVIVLLVIILSVFLGTQLSYLRFANQDNSDMLPEGITVIEEFDYIAEEFGGTDSVSILIELNPLSNDAENKYDDIREPDIIKYTEKLALATLTIQDVEGAESAGTFIKRINQGIDNGKIPNTINEIREYDELLLGNYISKDYSATIIRIDLKDEYDYLGLYNDLNKIISTTDKPAGIVVTLSGDIVTDVELEEKFGADMSKTSNFALLGIVIVILLIFRSFRYGLIPLTTILFANLWSFGLLGLLRLPITSVMTGVSSMIMGIGIDFGIQVVSRYRYEKNSKETSEAIKKTLSKVIMPLSTTTLAALIGFRAMSLGQLTMMKDIGTMMSYGVLFSMLASITVIPVLLIYTERINFRKNKQLGRKTK